MRFWKVIWKDVKRGENLELLIAVALAIVLGSLQLLSVDVAKYVMHIGLGAIAAFSVALLRIHHRLDSRNPAVAGVYKNWGVWDVTALLRNARSSITVVDSWPCEATEIARSIGEAAAAAKGEIEVNFYFMDADEPYGAQRIAEMSEKPHEVPEYAARERFREQCLPSLDRLQEHLKNVSNVDVHIHKYGTMPSLRLYAIDDAEFVFCWFPLGKSTSDAACFHLSARSGDESLYPAIEEIRDQLRALRAVSTEV